MKNPLTPSLQFSNLPPYSKKAHMRANLERVASKKLFFKPIVLSPSNTHRPHTLPIASYLCMSTHYT